MSTAPAKEEELAMLEDPVMKLLRMLMAKGGNKMGGMGGSSAFLLNPSNIGTGLQDINHMNLSGLMG